MDVDALTSLHLSIIAWENKLLEDDPRLIMMDAKNCPLCVAYLKEDCINCPIYNYTGRVGCMETPHVDSLITLKAWKRAPADQVLKERTRQCILAEINFLKSLLPKEE